LDAHFCMHLITSKSIHKTKYWSNSNEIFIVDNGIIDTIPVYFLDTTFFILFLHF